MAKQSIKVCTSCNQSLPIGDFHSARNRQDGRYSYCKPCCKKKLEKRAQSDPSAEAKRKLHKRAYDAARYKERRSEVIANVKAGYKKNPDATKKRVRDWQQQNPEVVRAYKASNKAVRRSIERKGISGRALLAWKKQQDKICHWCSADCGDDYHVDHYVPLSRGGKHELDNLVIACPTCNLRKHAKDPLEFAQENGRLF